MASTIETPRSQNYVDFDEYIDYQLQKTRGNIKTTDILTAFAFAAVFVLAYLLLFVIADHWLVADGFSQSTRTVLLSIVAVVTVGWLSWKVVWPYLRQVNQLFAAKIIEKSQPELRSTLLNLIDARAAGKQVSPEILTAMEKRAAVSISHTNVDDAVDRRPLMWACYAVLGLVMLFSLYTVMTPKKVSASIWRALFPVADVQAPTETVIESVNPGDVEVIPGTRLEVLVDLSGKIPEKTTLYYTTADREFVDEPIEMREVPEMPKRFRAEIIGANGEGIQQSLSYSVKAGDDRSQTFQVAVFQPPSADIVELHYSYPKYMEREPKTLPTGNIDDYEGVIVTFLAEGNMPLKSATIAFHDDQGSDYRSQSIPMSPINAERTRFRANWTLNISSKRGTYPRYYTIECKNERGDRDPSPTRWPIRIHPDKPPEAQILNPRESEIERPANAILPLTASARDDFKVTSLTLWKQRGDEEPVRHRPLFEGSEVSLSVDYDWRLNEGWELETGDVVSYWIQAVDNREPNAGRINTDKQTIRIQEERPEEEVQQQLENDRRPEQKKSDSEESPKNQEGEGQQDERSTDGGMGEEETENQQPMPSEGDPEQEQTGESKSEDENSDANKGGSGTAESKENGGEGQPVKNDGSEDDEALERLHQHYNENQTEPGEENPETGNNADQSNDPGENNQDPNQENKPGEKPEQQPNGKDPQNQDPNADPEMTDGNKEETKRPKEPGADEKPNKEPGAEKDPNKEPGAEENETDPMPNEVDETQTPDGDAEENESKPGQTTKPGNAESPNDGAAKPSPMESDPGGSDDTPGEGTPSKATDPNASKTGKPTGSEDMKSGEPGEGSQTEEPLDGTETPGDPDKDAERRDPTGDETGKGTAEDDPQNAEPAKNNIDREDSEKPTATKERPGNPEELPDETPTKSKEPKTRPDESTTPNRAKETNQKPAKENTNPEQETAPEPGEKPERNPAESKNQPNMGEDEPKGPGRPDGQQAEKPDGGEAGSSKQDKEGTPGGDDKGPGDTTPRPGDRDPAEKPNGAKPGEEKGPGSSSRPTEKDQDAGSRKGNPPPNADPNDSTKAEDPMGTEPGGPGAEGQPTRDKPNQRTGESGPPDFGRGNGDDTPITPEAARAKEKANLEYGREATDLALKKLENELKRGEINEEWLKEMGWDKADAEQFVERMKDRLNPRDDSTPEALAKQRQFNEWLKRLNKPNSKTSRREGSRVENRGARELIDSRTNTPPPELRDYYKEYQIGISERSK